MWEWAISSSSNPHFLPTSPTKIHDMFNKNRHLAGACASLLLIIFTSCIGDNYDLDTLISESDEAIQPIDINFDYSPLAEVADEPITDVDDPYYNDYVENDTFDREIYITYDGDNATIEGDYSGIGIDTDGAHVTINSTKGRTHYVMRGTSNNGSLKVYSEHKYKLTLDGVTLTNPTGAAINNQCGKSLYLVINDGTENSLTDGTTYSIPTYEQMKGAIFSEGQIIVSGNGLLNVTAHGGHGIATDDYIRFRPGCRVSITATAGHGVKANDEIIVDGGVLNIDVTGDGYKGLKCDLDIAINGGRTTVITSGASKIIEESLETLADTSSCAGIKSDAGITINGGTVCLKSIGEGGKGINAAGDLTINGGIIKVVTTGSKVFSSPKGIKSDTSVNINGGSIYSYSHMGNPLDAPAINIADGYVSIESLKRRFTLTYP